MERRDFIRASAGLGAIAGFSSSAAAAVGPEYENRAILDESLRWVNPDWRHPESAENFCRRVAMAGFNVIIPAVWHGRGTIWPSRLAPWDSHRSAQRANVRGFDPLQRLIDAAHKRGLEVHPWFCVSRRGRDFFSEFQHFEKHPRSMFDVHNPKFRDWIVELITEVMARYDVQGVYLDYIRSGTGFYLNRRWQEMYAKASGGRSLQGDYAGKEYDRIRDWQERSVGDIVRRVSARARALPHSPVVAVNGRPEVATEVQGRDVKKWVGEGHVDVLHAGYLGDEPCTECAIELRDNFPRPKAVVMLCGNYEDNSRKNYPALPGKIVADRIRASRSVGGENNGVALYLYNRFTDQQLRVLSRTVFSRPAATRWIRAHA